MKLSTLKKRAQVATKFRGHAMLWGPPNYIGSDRYTLIGTCKRCGRDVCLNTKPLPNEIDIGGGAVALNCTNLK